MVYRLIRLLIAVPVIRLLIRPRVRGRANVPRTGPVILVANHLSLADPVLLSTVVTRPISYVVKSEYFTGPGVLGRLSASFFLSLHQVPVDRSGGTAADAALASARVLLAAGEVFGIFPEGTRSPDGLLHRGRTGVARVALATGAPVVPVGLVGTDRVLASPSTRIAPHPGRVRPYSTRLRPHSTRLRLGRPEIRFGTPLVFGPESTPDRERLREVTEQVMAAVGALSGQERSDLDARDVGRPDGGASVR